MKNGIVFLNTLCLLLLTNLMLMGQSSWPQYSGPKGDFSFIPTGVEYATEIKSAAELWKSEAKDIPRGKLLSSPCNVHISNPSGGMASLVVGDDMVFATYFRPNDTIYRSSCTADPAWGIAADDEVTAMDANTGKTLWRQTMVRKGATRTPTKRGGWGVTPVYHEGVLYVTGTLGKIYAFDAKNGGNLLWESNVGNNHEILKWCLEDARSKSKLLEDSRYYPPTHLSPKFVDTKSLLSSMNMAGGVLIVPADFGDLVGVNPTNGNVVWTAQGVLSETSSPMVATIVGKEYVIANTRTAMRLIDPLTGTVLWTHPIGEHLGNIIVDGDLAFANTLSAGGVSSIRGLYGAYKLTAAGATKLWALPEQDKYKHSWTLDGGALRKIMVRGEYVYFIITKDNVNLHVAADKNTGEVHAEKPISGSAWGICYAYGEGQLFIHDDLSHPNSTQGMQRWSEYGKGFSLIENWTPPHNQADGYEVPHVNPIIKGIAYFRSTSKEVIAYDWRKGAVGVSLTIPSENGFVLTGTDLKLTATASVKEGNITKVEFYNGTTLLHTSTSLPREYVFSNIPAGSYVFKAKAYSDKNTEGWSNSVSITATTLLKSEKAITINQNITVFPNPCTHLLTVTGNVPKVMSLYNLHGKMVAAVSESNSMDVSHVPNGVYILQVGSERFKVTVSH